jgi:hypothetical protein
VIKDAVGVRGHIGFSHPHAEQSVGGEGVAKHGAIPGFENKEGKHFVGKEIAIRQDNDGSL